MPYAVRLLLAWVAVALTGPVVAEPESLRASKPEVRREIVALIDAQLAAFRRGDLVGAYSLFAADLQVDKPLSLFAAIVRANYPEMLGNTRAEYGIVRDDGVNARVLVHVYTAERHASYDYTLVRERGRWRIHGIIRHILSRDEQV